MFFYSYDLIISLQRLARDLIKEAFGIKHLYAIFAKDSAKPDEIQRFEAGVSSGPRLDDVRIDKHGKSVLMLKRSAWNRQIQLLLVQEAENIASQFPDGRFEQAYDWKHLFAERIYRILRDEINGQRLPGESHEERTFRILTELEKGKEKKGQTSIRHLVRITSFLIFSCLTVLCRSTIPVPTSQLS